MSEVLQRLQINEKLVVVNEKWLYSEAFYRNNAIALLFTVRATDFKSEEERWQIRRVMIMVALNNSKPFFYIEVLGDNGSINCA